MIRGCYIFMLCKCERNPKGSVCLWFVKIKQFIFFSYNFWFYPKGHATAPAALRLVQIGCLALILSHIRTKKKLIKKRKKRGHVHPSKLWCYPLVTNRNTNDACFSASSHYHILSIIYIYIYIWFCFLHIFLCIFLFLLQILFHACHLHAW